MLTVFEMVGLSSKEVCGFVLGKTCASDYNPWQQNWNVTIPGGKPPVTPVNPPKVCQRKLCVQYPLMKTPIHAAWLANK